MIGFDKDYPEYGFGKHKGYGTKYHLDSIKNYGACPIHRKTFKGVYWLNEEFIFTSKSFIRI